jgi:hypothetical protein
MRTLFGIIVGAGLTIGGAYVHDTLTAAQSLPGMARTIVNWDVATEVAGNASRAARREFDRLFAR